jgi:Zn-dependent protease with chaperone function
VLGLLASALLRAAAPVAEASRHDRMTFDGPVSAVVAAAAAAALAVAALRLVRVAQIRVRTRAALGRVRRRYPPGTELTVAASPVADVFAVPGRPGMTVVTTGMLKATTAEEQAVLFAHERSHLRHRHSLLRAAAEAAAAVSPVLVGARDAVAYLTERWADEDAAAEAGSLQLAASCLALAALAPHPAGPAPGRLRRPGRYPQGVRAARPAPAPRRS